MPFSVFVCFFGVWPFLFVSWILESEDFSEHETRSPPPPSFTLCQLTDAGRGFTREECKSGRSPVGVTADMFKLEVSRASVLVRF